MHLALIERLTPKSCGRRALFPLVNPPTSTYTTANCLTAGTEAELLGKASGLPISGRWQGLLAMRDASGVGIGCNLLRRIRFYDEDFIFRRD